LSQLTELPGWLFEHIFFPPEDESAAKVAPEPFHEDDTYEEWAREAGLIHY
jgi:hypothetical protein